MFEELNAHRKSVQENIRKAFEIGFTGNEDLEKAYQVGDEQTDKHGVTYYVHALNAAGKPLWRKKKDSGANANNSGLTEQEKKEKLLLESAARSGHRLLQRDAHRLDVLQRKERQAAAENISKSFETDFEKGRDGVYVDNSENRRLGRVGMSYTNGFKRGARVTATLPTGKVISGKFKEFYGNGKYASIKTDDGHTYGVAPDKVKLESSPKKSSEKKVDVNKVKSQIRDLQRERRAVEVDMEEELAQLGEESINNGNNPVVKRYSSMLDKIDSKISNLQSKIQPERKRVFHSYESYMKEKPVEGEDYHYE